MYSVRKVEYSEQVSGAIPKSLTHGECEVGSSLHSVCRLPYKTREVPKPISNSGSGEITRSTEETKM